MLDGFHLIRRVTSKAYLGKGGLFDSFLVVCQKEETMKHILRKSTFQGLVGIRSSQLKMFFFGIYNGWYLSSEMLDS